MSDAPLIKGGLRGDPPLIRGDPPAYRHPPYQGGQGGSNLKSIFNLIITSYLEEACDARGRGGFERLSSQGQKGSIEFQIYYKEDYNSRPITYEFRYFRDKLRHLSNEESTTLVQPFS